jgi:hypothetical protein
MQAAFQECPLPPGPVPHLTFQELQDLATMARAIKRKGKSMSKKTWTSKPAPAKTALRTLKGGEEAMTEGKPIKPNETFCSACDNVESIFDMESPLIDGRFRYLCKQCRRRLWNFYPESGNWPADKVLEKLAQVEAILDGGQLFDEAETERAVSAAYDRGIGAGKLFMLMEISEHGPIVAADAAIHAEVI